MLRVITRIAVTDISGTQPLSIYNPTLKKMILQINEKNVSCEYDRLNGWNSAVQAARYIHQARLLDGLILYFIYKLVSVN